MRSSIADREVLGGDGHDVGRGDLGGVAVADQVLQHALGQVHVDVLLLQAGERGDPDQGALELADVALDLGWR